MDSPIDRRHTGHVLLRADALAQQPVPDLPREHSRILALVVGNRIDHRRRRDFRFAAPDDARFEAARFVITATRCTKKKSVRRPSLKLIPETFEMYAELYISREWSCPVVAVLGLDAMRFCSAAEGPANHVH